ncbi:SPRY domain-containing protein 7-like [Tropilaelaps mercedesae]|uniref:SPRY domain-containing protein 7 n=1 Tax=Tropilaelaps mercedesae TaxID=418985 RepID=A0A1V9X5D4_9ACAR|nr:SPRY domain-containing protein 7-like [Tropilaelaps mercedesae]
MECLGCIRAFFIGDPQIPQYTRLPPVHLDTQFMGENAVIVKNGHRLCGSGASLANHPIAQNKAYFEVKLQQGGMWGVGIATRDVDLNNLPLGTDFRSVVLRDDGCVVGAGSIRHRLPQQVQEGDVLGVAYDHLELRFFLNGVDLHVASPGIKAEEVYPIVYVDGGAVMETAFSSFYHQPPPGYQRILIEQSLL